MGAIEAEQSFAVRVAQCERVAQSVRALRGRRCRLYFEFQPVASFKVMNTAVKSQQELKRVWV